MKKNNTSDTNKIKDKLDDAACAFYSYVIQECDDVPLDNIIAMFISLAAKVAVDSEVKSPKQVLISAAANAFEHYYDAFLQQEEEMKSAN